jgi:hypothetical protein
MDFGSGSTGERIPGSDPLPLPISKGYESLKKERVMNPIFIIAIPLGLVILGMILNSLDLGFVQPPSSPEQDPVKRSTAESASYRKFFEHQRRRAMKRQKRVGQYGWLYTDTVTKTGLSSRIAGLQTLGTEEGKQMVLSVTLTDGQNVKYLIKLPPAEKLETAAKEEVRIEKVSSWELERLGTALSTGDNPLPLGVALKIAN